MDMSSIVLLLAALTLSVISFCIYSRQRLRRRKIPPGPFPFPVVGNIFQLNGVFHTTLAKLSKKYGPLISIKVFNRTFIVISSPEIAKELFQKYDHTFTKRQVLDMSQAFDHYKFSVIFLPAEKQWRDIRKLCREQIFSSVRLNATQGIRQEKVQQLCNYVQECCIDGKEVDIGEVTFTTVLNFLSGTIFSVDFARHDSDASRDLKEIVHGVIEIFATPNLVDFFPVLRMIDPQGIRRQAKIYFGKLMETFDDIINQRLKEKGSSLDASFGKSDVLDVLLEMCREHEDEWSYNDIKHLILDLFIGGLDTTSSTVEWTMAELLRNPRKMKRVVKEIREVIGSQNKQIQESDISNLPYLQAVVKESFRLHPVGVITARKPSDDMEIKQYIVPKDADIFLNIWAINRDPNAWFDPDSFIPERFLDSKIDAKGQHFELLTFGAGRRMCPGMSLAHRMVHLIVASFLHNFDWELENGASPENMDMSETSGFAAHKALPLRAFPIKGTL